MKSFETLKQEFIELLRDKSPCQPEYKKVLQSTTQEELLLIIFNNLKWCSDHKVFTQLFLDQFNAAILLASGLAQGGKENTGIVNSGNRNSGDRNLGYRNSGDRNSGDSNSGYRNLGDRNSGDRNLGDRNLGDRNSGNWNSGNSNSGDSNSGNWNSRDSNSGYRNSGNRNSGDSNSGYSNSGNWNSGDRNLGYRNSGNWNSGNWNSGNWNSGDRNSGDSNSGYRNSGAFCTDPNPKLILFDVQTDILVRDWERHEACQIMNNLTPNIWVDSSIMTADEKAKFPTHETTGGYLKTIPYKEAWNNLWGNLTDAKKKVFADLPFFDSDKFFQITGIKL